VSIPIESVTGLVESYPYLAAFVTCGAKASAADAVAQVKDRTDDDNSAFEFPRNLSYIIYGGVYQGMVQEYLFNHFLPRLFGSGTDVQTVAVKVMFDMLILSPLLCLPVAYLVKGVLLGQGGIYGGLQRYKADVLERGLIFKYWALWGPVQCLTFSIVPEHFRITWVAVVSFFWLIILSSLSSKGLKEEKDGDVCILSDSLTCES